MKEHYANAYTFNAIVQVVEEVFFIRTYGGPID